MEMIQQLGINGTALYQFILFGCAFFFLTYVVFQPYSDALFERENRTKGGEELAEELQKQSNDLRAEYETKAKDISGQVKTIFDSYRDEAQKEYERILSAAREESAKLIEDARKKISAQAAEATIKAKEEIPALANLIVSKLLKG